jgi:sialidase-1
MEGVEPIPLTITIGPVTCAPNGRVFCCYAESPPGGGKQPGLEQYVLGRWSDDHGRNWSPPEAWGAYRPTPGRLLAPRVLATRGGALHLFYLRFHHLAWESFRRADESRCELWHRRSDDLGLTWTDPQRLAGDHPYVVGKLEAFESSTGRIFSPINYLTDRTIGRFAATVLYSDDRGETWHSIPRPFEMDFGGDVLESGAIEPVMEELAGGALYMLIRTQNGFQYQTRSGDDGLTWSRPQPTPLRSANKPAGLLRLSDGRLLAAWTFTESVLSVFHDCRRIHMAVSRDDARTWSPSVEVVGVEEGQANKYPFLVESPEGRVLMAYACQSPTAHGTQLIRIDPDALDRAATDAPPPDL